MAKIFGDTEIDIVTVSKELRNGGIVAVPTETVYGLACDALNENSCKKIFEIKERPFIDPLIIHVLDISAAKDLAYFNDIAEKLAEKFWPGPLTIVLQKNPLVSNIITANRNTVAIRSPSHPLLRKLLAQSKIPLAAPSANPFGYISPTSANHVQDSLGDKIDYIIDGGECEIGLESTIIDLSDESFPTLLRTGSISTKEISKCINLPIIEIDTKNNLVAEGAPAPGLLKNHYSPHTPLILLDFNLPCQKKIDEQDAVVLFNKSNKQAISDHKNLFWLTEKGDLSEAAHNLYNLLRNLDNKNFNKIFFEKVPNSDLGKAINDRLEKAQNS